jgi:dihydroorotate dehydrogenase electron transfer subunit
MRADYRLAASVIIPRVPVNRDVPLVRREPLEGPYSLLTFRHPEVANGARAGQFVMVKAGLSAEPPLRRPFSIMRVDPREDTFTLFLKEVGEGSRALCALAPGELAQCLGPLGRPFAPPADGAEALLVAGGYGIAPFVLLCDELRRTGVRARVFYGGRSAADLQLCAPFERLGVPLVCATEDGSRGVRGRVTAPLEAHLDAQPGPAELLACGPDAMLHAVARVGERRRLPTQVSLDPWMGCGIGTCLGCVVWIQDPDQPRPKYRCACTEGPVFDARVVVWPGDSRSLARRDVEVRA